MTTLLWLIPVLPLLGFGVLAIRGRAMPKGLVAAIGVGTVGLAAGLALVLAGWFLIAPPAGGALTVTFWTWFQVGGLSPAVAFRLDALSLIFTLVVTVVGFLIHLYSAE